MSDEIKVFILSEGEEWKPIAISRTVSGLLPLLVEKMSVPWDPSRGPLSVRVHVGMMTQADYDRSAVTHLDEEIHLVSDSEMEYLQSCQADARSPD